MSDEQNVEKIAEAQAIAQEQSESPLVDAVRSLITFVRAHRTAGDSDVEAAIADIESALADSNRKDS